MSVDVMFHTQSRVEVDRVGRTSGTRYFVPLGRILFSAIFVLSSFEHFSGRTIEHAASHGVPFAAAAVPIAGVLALLGGVSILTGYRARLGAALLVLFLVPVTFTLHAFWAVHDPQSAQLQLVMFMKNLGLLGGALLIGYFGAGPISVDARQGRA